MPQDAFNLRRCIIELNSVLKGGKINRVIQPDKDEVSFNIYTGKTVLKLILNTNASNARVCLSKTEKDAPLVAPNFCMLLRKHLVGGEIISIEQVGFERIVALTVHCVTDFSSCDRVLYAEIMGKYSNLILVENGVILGALKTTSIEENCKRILFPGAKYSFPAPQDKVSPLDEKGLAELLSSKDEITPEFLFERVSGIAMSTAAQITDSYTGEIPFDEHLKKFLFEGENKPCVQIISSIPKDFSAKPLPFSKPFESVNEAQDYFFTYKERVKAFDAEKRKLKNAVSGLIKKQEKNLARIRDKKAECADMENNRLKGELITSYIYMLKQGMDGCTLVNYYDPNGGSVKISLDKQLTPSQNAQKYYKKYNKQKRTLAVIDKQLETVLKELDYSESVLSFIDGAEDILDLKETEEELISLGLLRENKNAKKKKEAEIPFRKFDIGGFTVLAGRNNVQNDRLLKRLSASDIWLHTQKYHSSHVAVISEGKKVPDEVILQAARICAYYSEARNGDKVPVDYCERKFVKKPPKSPVGFVIYTDYNTILVTPSL